MVRKYSKSSEQNSSYESVEEMSVYSIFVTDCLTLSLYLIAISQHVAFPTMSLCSVLKLLIQMVQTTILTIKLVLLRVQLCLRQ